MAKTYGHTFEKIIDLDNIEDAIRAAAKGKRKRNKISQHDKAKARISNV